MHSVFLSLTWCGNIGEQKMMLPSVRCTWYKDTSSIIERHPSDMPDNSLPLILSCWRTLISPAPPVIIDQVKLDTFWYADWSGPFFRPLTCNYSTLRPHVNALSLTIITPRSLWYYHTQQVTIRPVPTHNNTSLSMILSHSTSYYKTSPYYD